MNEDQRMLSELLSKRSIILSDQQFQQFERYYELLVEWNERMNLTGITERTAVYEKHFYDSVSLDFYVNVNSITTMADIGSGAGFPSLPLKICYPHLKVTIVDSLNKRIQFLSHLVDELGLSEVTCVHSRAEDTARFPEHRDRYDLVTARAVARLNALNELCLPFVRIGGQFASMKGSDPAEEVAEAKKSLKELNGALVSVNRLELPFEKAERHIILINKTGATPKHYPRKAGTPIKQPIL